MRRAYSGSAAARSRGEASGRTAFSRIGRSAGDGVPARRRISSAATRASSGACSFEHHPRQRAGAHAAGARAAIGSNSASADRRAPASELCSTVDQRSTATAGRALGQRLGRRLGAAAKRRIGIAQRQRQDARGLGRRQRRASRPARRRARRRRSASAAAVVPSAASAASAPDAPSAVRRLARGRWPPRPRRRGAGSRARCRRARAARISSSPAPPAADHRQRLQRLAPRERDR